MDIHFCCFLFLNDRNITYFIFLVCMIYTNDFWTIVSWNYKNWSFTKYEPLNMLLLQFRYFHLSYFSMTFDINILGKSFPFLRLIFKVLVRVCCLKKFYDQLTLDSEMVTLYFFFKVLHEDLFLLLFISKLQVYDISYFSNLYVYADGFWTIANQDYLNWSFSKTARLKGYFIIIIIIIRIFVFPTLKILILL